ncbi:MAG: SagB/ThcOx family dehydrogenase [Pseudomonadota bacterium]
MTVEESIAGRRSRRDFSGAPLTLGQLGQLLWSMQGCTGAGCLRAAPSAGATFPLEIFAAVGEGGVEGLEAGVYRYHAEDHEIALFMEGDLRRRIAAAALRQLWIPAAPVTIIVCADYSRTEGRYGLRGRQYVHMEVGHAGQNLYLQAESLGLGTVGIGAFDEDAIARMLGVAGALDVLTIMPVGKCR